MANPVMIEAYKAGIPGDGNHFPDGSQIAKIHWNAKKSAVAPAPTLVPDTLHDVDFIERDSKSFPAPADGDMRSSIMTTSPTPFSPEGSGSDCGYACHTIVTAKDYIFTAYPDR